jgi:O-6-methylguanine DNA methyltransferase
MKQKKTIVATLRIETEVGDFIASYTPAGLARLDFPKQKSRPAKTDSDVEPVKYWHELTKAAVRRALRGEPMTSFPPVDLSCGTDFQRKVWRALRAIPPGKTETYSHLAASLNKPKAARAVGSACGANPVPVLIPCHRVIAAHGRLGGFSSGLRWKKKLLGVECGQEFEKLKA